MQKINIKKILYPLIVIIFFLISFFLRLKAAIMRPIIFDEAFTITYLAKLDTIDKMIFADASVPPLHYLLIKLMSQISTNALWFRAPSLLFSMLSLWISYKFTKKFSKKAALLTLIMLSFSTFHLLFSWQAYVYSQLFFLGVTTLYLFFHLLTDKNIKNENLKAFLVFIAGTTAFLTHYGFIWTIAGLFLILLHKLTLAKPNHKKIKSQHRKLFLAMAGIFAFLISYSPIIIYNWQKALNNISWFDPINIYSVGQSFEELLGFYDQFGWNVFLNSDFNKFLPSIILLCMITYLMKLKDRNINLLIFMAMANLLLPIISSVILGKNMHATRAIITSSFTLTALFAIFIEKIFKNKLFYLFLIPFIVFYIKFFLITNRNYENFSQEFDNIKQYANWFRKNPTYLEEEKFIFVYNRNHPISLSSSFVNYFVLDYYWYGYDGKEPLYNYKKIKTIKDIQRENFYLLTVSEFETDEEIDEVCPNKKTIQILSYEEKLKKTFDLYYYDAIDMFVYECNSKE